MVGFEEERIANLQLYSILRRVHDPGLRGGWALTVIPTVRILLGTGNWNYQSCGFSAVKLAPSRIWTEFVL